MTPLRTCAVILMVALTACSVAYLTYLYDYVTYGTSVRTLCATTGLGIRRASIERAALANHMTFGYSTGIVAGDPIGGLNLWVRREGILYSWRARFVFVGERLHSCSFHKFLLISAVGVSRQTWTERSRNEGRPPIADA